MNTQPDIFFVWLCFKIGKTQPMVNVFLLLVVGWCLTVFGAESHRHVDHRGCPPSELNVSVSEQYWKPPIFFSNF